MSICVCRLGIMIYILLAAQLLRAEASFFSTLSMRDGLPSNIITSIAQDRHDFLWIGTGSGLARYDGYNFKIFKKSESTNSISNNGITTLLALNNDIWIGTWTGLCKIDIETFEVSRIDLGLNSAIRTLFIGDNKILWVGTNDGLIRYSMESGESKLFNNNNSGLSHNTIRAIYENADGDLFIGTFDKFNKLQSGKDRFQVWDLDGEEQHSPTRNHLILDIKPQKEPADQMLWIGTDRGLYSLNSTTGDIQHFSKEKTGFSNNVIKCIYTDIESNLWLGTDFGLNIFNFGQMTVNNSFHNPQQPFSIPSNVIWQFLQDSSGIIWLATSNGLCRISIEGNFYEYHNVSYNVENQISGNQVKSVLVSSKGNYWLGTLHGAIRIDPKTGKRRFFDFSPYTGNNVYALEEDQYGRIWIGTAGGINIWDNNEQKMYPVTANDSNGLTSNYIGKLLSTNDGSFWVSEWEGGLYKVDDIDKKPDDFNFIPIRGLESGSEKIVYGKGSIWIIEFDELYRVNPKDYTKSHIESFSKASEKQMIYSIYFSRSGHLWAGTLNGLIQYIPDENKSVFHPMVTGNEIMINSIIEDQDGNIWSTSNTSLHKYYPKANTVEIYPLDKDLPLKSFYYGCAAITKDNKIIFGGDNGYITFSPENVKPNLFNAKIYITSVEINNQRLSVNDILNGKITLQKDVAFTKELVLDYEQRSISFEFSSLHYWQPFMNAFSYHMEGFDEEWNQVSGTKNFAVYSNLAAGDYQFVVKGTNNYGIPSDHTAKLAFTIKPPLLLRKGFIALYFILIIVIIYYALRFYSTRVRLKNELKIIKMEKVHAEEIELTKEEFFTNISHELRTPISLILPPIHEIQKRGRLDNFSRDLITLAEKNAVRLLRLVNQVLDFNKLGVEVLRLKVSEVEMVSFCRDIFSLFEDQAKRNQIDFVLESKVELQTAWIDAEKLETVLFNLLSNAFKFTSNGGSIKVVLSLSENPSEINEGVFQIVVKDSGVGIPKEDQKKIFERFYQTPTGKKKESGSGIGLTLVAEYIELHHGFIQLDSEINKGTTFTVSIPLGKSHLPVDSIKKDAQIKLLAKPSLHKDQNGSRFYQLKLESDKPTVLLIDDNMDMIDFIRTSLSHKYNFVLAQNGHEGLRKANNFSPNIIVSDIMMPKMDGLELCRKVKENPKTTHISIIFISAKSMTENRVEGIRVGADAYIVKPFEIELLEAQIDTLIQRQKELKEYFRNELIHLPVKPDSSNNEDNKFVKRVMDLIEANISNSELTVEMIAGEMAMSSTHLYRRLKSITDHSAKEIIQKYRLKKASQLLQNKEGNITEVMYRVGFTNSSYFSKCFKAEYEVSPKQYQESVNG